MKSSILSGITILILALVQSTFCQSVSRIKLPAKRSYQLPQVALPYNPQGIQYYAGPIYTIPTVFIPNQIGLPATPVTKVVLPPTTENKPAQEFRETSTQVYVTPKPAKTAGPHYKQKHRSYGLTASSKRQSVYAHPMRLKPLSSIPPPKSKISSLSIQPSIDLSGQFSQEVSSSLYPTTAGPPVVSTYGPPKTVDYLYKTRLSGVNGQSVYHKSKGPSHRHPHYPAKKLRVYSHVHKDHIHNHYIPPGSSFPLFKHHSKYSAPAYLPPSHSTKTAYSEEDSQDYPYQSKTHVKFPQNEDTHQLTVKEPQEVIQQPNYTPGDVTQAIIKNPGVINNYDANIPLHVPSKKPYQFEVNQILKNSELHFVQEAPTHQNNQQNTQTIYSNVANTVQQYIPKMPYQNNLIFGTPQQLYTPLPVDQSAGYIQSVAVQNQLTGQNPLDIYNLPGVNAYQSNHIAPDQDLGTSETIKVPVAVIRGPHNIAGQGLYGFTVKRQDESNTANEDTKNAFTPSKRTSDWIPMSGNGIPITTNESKLNKLQETEIETLSDQYYSPSTKKETRRQLVGDIISGKIPAKYSPKTIREEDGKLTLVRNPGNIKGSVTNVYPSASSEVINPGDTSDLVVSSVIKFS